MSVYRDHFLPKIQASHEVGGGHRHFWLVDSVFKDIEAQAGTGDQSAKSLLSRLTEAAGAISRPEELEKWNGFIDAYEEGCVWLVARARGVFLNALPVSSIKTPDFSCSTPSTAWFELKTLGVNEGVFAQKGMLYDGLDATMQAEGKAKRAGIGFGEAAFAPHGPGATALDVVRQVIDKITNNVKRGQFQQNPTYMIASLDRLSAPFPEAFRVRNHLHDGERLSSVLWHAANGQIDDDFLYHSRREPIATSAKLERVGILGAFPAIAGVVFKVSTWHELPHEDAPFKHQAYKLYGVRRDDAHDHRSFDALCSEKLIV